MCVSTMGCVHVQYVLCEMFFHGMCAIPLCIFIVVMVQLVRYCLLAGCFVTVTVAVNAFMVTVVESKKNFPKGIIKYIVSYHTVSYRII